MHRVRALRLLGCISKNASGILTGCSFLLLAQSILSVLPPEEMVKRILLSSHYTMMAADLWQIIRNKSKPQARQSLRFLYCYDRIKVTNSYFAKRRLDRVILLFVFANSQFQVIFNLCI